MGKISVDLSERLSEDQLQDYALLRYLYDKEIERTKIITDKIKVVLGVITINGGFIVVNYNTVTLKNNYSSYLYNIFVLLFAIFAFAITIFTLAFTSKINSAIDISEYGDKLLWTLIKANYAKIKRILAENDDQTLNYLFLPEYTQHLSIMNNRKERWLFVACIMSLISMIWQSGLLFFSK